MILCTVAVDFPIMPAIIYMEAEEESDLKPAMYIKKCHICHGIPLWQLWHQESEQRASVFPLTETMETLGTVLNKHYAHFFQKYFQKME